MTAME